VRCEECNGNLVYDSVRGETYCEDCGLVVEENIIDTRREWRVFSTRDFNERSRTGPAETYMLHDKGLGSEIFLKGKLRTLNKRIKFVRGSDRSKVTAINLAVKVCGDLHLPRYAVEDVCFYLNKVYSAGRTKGRPLEMVVAGTVYFVCRMRRIAKSATEIARVTGVKKKNVIKFYRVVVDVTGHNFKSFTVREYVDRYCAELRMFDKKDRVIELVSGIDDGSGKVNSRVAVAGAIYKVVCDEHLPIQQSKIMEVTGVSGTSIRKIRKVLDEHDKQKRSRDD